MVFFEGAPVIFKESFYHYFYYLVWNVVPNVECGAWFLQPQAPKPSGHCTSSSGLFKNNSFSSVLFQRFICTQNQFCRNMWSLPGHLFAWELQLCGLPPVFYWFASCLMDAHQCPGKYYASMDAYFWGHVMGPCVLWFPWQPQLCHLCSLFITKSVKF